MEAQQQGGGGRRRRGRALTWLKDTCSWQMGQLWLRKRSAEGKSALSCTASITSARLKLRSGMDISSSRVLARSGGSRAATWKGWDETGCCWALETSCWTSELTFTYSSVAPGSA